MVSLDLGNALAGFGSHAGSSPSPFDAVDGHRLAGPTGSHPLHGVSIDELVRPGSGDATADFVLDHPVRVGEGITGRVRVSAVEPIQSRSAHLRLVGLRLVENRRSRQDHDAKGRVTHTETWVEVSGQLFVEDAFPEPAIPASLAAGEAFEVPFAVPAPPLGPPTAHLGEAIVAWALEIRWDVPRARDTFVAVEVPVGQHPDLLRAGVGKQGGLSLMDTVSVDGATIDITSPLPAAIGSTIQVRVHWPDAPGGREARIELHRRNNAPNAAEGIVASASVASDSLAGGSDSLAGGSDSLAGGSDSLAGGDAAAQLLVPEGSAPSFDGAGLEIAYVIRVLVDRRFMPDAAIERPVGIA